MLMNKNIMLLIKAKLKNNCLTCVIADSKEIIFTSAERGVSPLINFINEFKADKDFYLADKVIGKAAALLCVKARINYVYTSVISIPAEKILTEHNISFEFENEVTAVQNRTKTGLCPMESLSKGVNTPDEMYNKVLLWLADK